MKNQQISSALKISLIYALIGGIWILLSDRAATILFTNPDQLSIVQTYKGWFYVIVTALILFILIKNDKNTLDIAEQNFTDLFESATEGIFRSSPKGRFINVNEAMFQIFGYDSPEEMIEKISDISTQIHLSAGSRNQFTEVLEQNGVVKRFEAINIKKDGSKIWTSTNARVVKDKNGKILYYEGLVTDITKQKNAENAILKAEARYRMLVEKLPAVIFLDEFNDLQSTQYISPRIKALLGYSPEEWKSDDGLWENSLHPNDKDRVIAEDIRTNETGEPFRIEYRLRHRDGHHVWIKEDASIIMGEGGTPLFWQGVLLDITDQKKIEEAIKANEGSYHQLFNSVTQAMYIQDKEGHFLDVNEGALKMYGYPREFFIGKTPETLSAPNKNDSKSIAQMTERAFAGEPQEFEFWGLRSNGQIFPKIVTLNKGTYFGQDVIIAIAQDITARKRDEGNLQKQLKELTVLHSVALAESVAENIDDLLQQVTDIIGDTLYPDNCGVLLLNETQDELKPHTSYRSTNKEMLALSMPLTEGITGKVAATGISIRVGDVSLEPAYYESTDGVLSELCVPIKNGTKIIGVLNVESKLLNAFAETDERLLNTIAGGMAKAIERIELFELEQKRRKQAEILRETTGELTSFFEMDKLFENIFISLAKLIDYDSASIEVINQGYFEIVAGRNIPKELIGKKYISRPEKWEGIHDLRKPVIISDAQQDSRFEKFKETSYIRGWMGIPLFVKDKIIGFLNLDSRTPNFFTQEHAALAQTFANQAAIAIENARLFQEESRRSQIIEALASIANEIAVTREILPALDKIAQHTLTLLKAISVAIYLLQDDNQTIKAIAVQGEYHEELLSHSIKIGEGITGNIIATGKPEIVDDMEKKPRRVPVPGTPKENVTLETMMSAPLSLHGKCIGAINVWRLKSTGLFDSSELNFLVSIAHQASISIESMRLFEETTRRAQEAAAIAEVGRGISATLQLDNVLERIAIYAKDLLKAETSAIYLTEPGTPLLRAISAIGIDADEIKNDPLELGVGILGDIAIKRSGEIVNNTAADSRAIPIMGTELLPHEHVMGVPVFSNDQITGLLVVWRVGADENFKATDLDFLSSLAQQAAVAIENARLFEAEHNRRQEAEILSQATSALANTLDIHSLFENILDWLNKIAPYDSASIMLTQGDTITLAAKRNLPQNFHIGQILPATEKWKEVIPKRKPLIIEDAQVNKIFEKWEGTAYIRGWMGIAMFTQDKLIGFINLDSKTIGAYTEEHSILVQTFANQAATAIENTRLFALEQKRRKDAEIVRQAATTLTNLLDLPSLHEAILDWLYKITPYDSAAILELEGERIRITAARGLPNPEKALNQTFPADNALCKIMNETFEPLILEDSEKDPRFERWGDVNKVHGWMGVPLISRGQVIGYLNLDSHIPNAFTQNDAVVAQTFAYQAATSLENSRLFTETKQRLDELEIISRVSFALRAAHDTKEMIPILLNEIKASVGTDSAAIWLYEIEHNELRSKATAGWFNNLQKSNFKPNEGVVGIVYSSGVGYVNTGLIDDPIADLESINFFGKNGGGIAVPIRTATETIGALAVALNAPRKIKSHQTRLITTLAEIAGNAINRSNLYERSEEQIQRLTTLRELDSAITSSLDLQIPLNILTEHLLTKMDVSAAAVLVFNPDSQTLDYYAATGFKNQENVRAPVGIGNGLAGQILLSRKAIFIKDLKQESSPLQTKWIKSEGFTSYYAVPLFSKGAARGVLETYFRQPFSPSVDWIEFLHTLGEQAIIAIDNAQLFENLQQSNLELSLAYDTTLEGWGKALELRDKETQGHTRRVTNLTLELARQMNIPEAELLQIRRGALLHDIGKMGVSDNILHKDGSLTEDEQFEMRKHPQYAYDMLYPIAYLRPALDIAYCHHEWWDGNGYPRGLKGKEIPLSARIFAIIDVWDALLSDRPYRKAWSQKKVTEYIRDLSGKQFDPQVVEMFFRMIENE